MNAADVVTIRNEEAEQKEEQKRGRIRWTDEMEETLVKYYDGYAQRGRTFLMSEDFPELFGGMTAQQISSKANIMKSSGLFDKIAMTHSAALAREKSIKMSEAEICDNCRSKFVCQYKGKIEESLKTVNTPDDIRVGIVGCAWKIE